MEAIMKAMVVLASALSLVSVEAQAISQYNSQSMSCDRVQAVVQGEGAVILHYSSARNPGLPLYDRYVANGTYCQVTEYAKLASVPASDQQSCRVLKCADMTNDVNSGVSGMQ